MKYINEFEKVSDFQAFMDENGGGGDALVSYIVETLSSVLKPYVPKPRPISAGDVAYWDGSNVKTTPLSKWKTSLGTPVGVVVVPEGFAPDGKVRIVSLYGVDKDGNQTNSYKSMIWGPSDKLVGVITKCCVPTGDNTGSTSSGSNNSGYLPSDSFTGAQSFVDPKAKYCSKSAGTNFLIPSPYLGDAPNPEYYKTLENGNALSDFDGYSNSGYMKIFSSEAGSAAKGYKDGASNLQWYLPAAGELGYIVPRFNEINNTITALGGFAMTSGDIYWSSTQVSDVNAFGCQLYYGSISEVPKDLTIITVRPFAKF